MLPVATPPNAIAHEVNTYIFSLCAKVGKNVIVAGLGDGNFNNDDSWTGP